MARQQRLLAKLGDAPIRASELTATPASRRLDPEQLRAEEAAIGEAAVLLDAGDIAAARETLAPWRDRASSVTTLTVLAGIAVAEGRFDDNIELLEDAERLEPVNTELWRALAEAYALARRYSDEVRYRRKLVFSPGELAVGDLVPWIRAALKAAGADGKPPPFSEIRLALEKLDRSPEANGPLRIRMAETLYSSGVVRESLHLYQQAIPLVPTVRDITAQWERLPDLCVERGIAAQSLRHFGAPGRRPMLAELTDVTVFPRLQWMPILDDGKTLLDGFVMQRLKLHAEDALSPMLMNNGMTAVLRLPADLPWIDEPCLLIGGMAQYYHNTIEYLSALAVAEELGVAADLRIVINDDLADFQRQQLALLGIGEDRLLKVDVDAPVRFKRLMVPSRLVRGGRWVDPLVPHWYRKRLAASVAPDARPHRRLYLSRAGTGRRRVINEADLLAALQSRGFESVAPEALSVREQIRLFAEATHIVGPTGAAFSNIVAAPTQTRVVTFYNRHLVKGGGDLYFDALAAAAGQSFHTIPCASARVVSEQRVIDADIQVDVDAVIAAIDA